MKNKKSQHGIPAKIQTARYNGHAREREGPLRNGAKALAGEDARRDGEPAQHAEAVEVQTLEEGAAEGWNGVRTKSRVSADFFVEGGLASKKHVLLTTWNETKRASTPLQGRR